jgi:hypothetical protein
MMFVSGYKKKKKVYKKEKNNTSQTNKKDQPVDRPALDGSGFIESYSAGQMLYVSRPRYVNSCLVRKRLIETLANHKDRLAVHRSAAVDDLAAHIR